MSALIPAIVELMFKLNRGGRGGGGGGRGYGGGGAPRPQKSDDQVSMEVAIMNARKQLTSELTEGAKLRGQFSDALRSLSGAVNESANVGADIPTIKPPK